MQPAEFNIQEALIQLHSLSKQFKELDVTREELPTLFLRTVGSSVKPELRVEKRGFFQWIMRTIWSSEYELQEGSRTTQLLAKLNQAFMNQTDAQVDEAIEALREKHPEINAREIYDCKDKIGLILKRVQEKKLIKARQKGGIVPTLLLFQKLGLPPSWLKGVEQVKVRLDLRLATLKERLKQFANVTTAIPESKLASLKELLANRKIDLAAIEIHTLIAERESWRKKIQLAPLISRDIQEMQGMYEGTEKGKFKEQIGEMLQKATQEKQALDLEIEQANTRIDQSLLPLFTLIDPLALQQELAQGAQDQAKSIEIDESMRLANQVYRRAFAFGTDAFKNIVAELAPYSQTRSEPLQKLYLAANALLPAATETLEHCKTVWRDNYRLDLIQKMLSWYAQNRETANGYLAIVKQAANEIKNGLGTKSREELLAFKKQADEAIHRLQEIKPIMTMSRLHERKFMKMLEMVQQETRITALKLIEAEQKSVREIRTHPLDEAYLARDEINQALSK